jgi:hypothetical protein
MLTQRQPAEPDRHGDTAAAIQLEAIQYILLKRSFSLVSNLERTSHTNVIQDAGTDASVAHHRSEEQQGEMESKRSFSRLMRPTKDARFDRAPSESIATTPV